MQRLAAALEQALVGRVLDQRVLEAVGRLAADALDDENVSLGEPVERGLQGGVGDPGYRAAVSDRGYGGEQRIGEIAPEHGANLRDLAC